MFKTTGFLLGMGKLIKKKNYKELCILLVRKNNKSRYPSFVLAITSPSSTYSKVSGSTKEMKN